jgi:hypothetical protein
MAEFTGKDCFVLWTSSAGTINMSADERSVSWNPSGGLVESTAGSDPFKSYLATTKDTTVDVSCVWQAGSYASENALLPLQFGTLLIGPEGSVAGKRSYQLPSFSQGAKFNFPYADVVEMSCSFQGSGTATYGTF